MSAAARSALERCIGIPIGEFAAQFWGREALLSSGGAFDDLFSIAAVDELLSERALRTPFIRMAKEGEVLAPSRFTGSGGYGAEVGDQVDPAKVLAEFAAGSTIVLQGLHRTWPALRTFTRELVAELGHPAQVNAYITPASSRGFDPHYDVHDVFVLQIAGQKRWVVHEPVHELPFADEPWSGYAAAVAERAAGAPAIDTVLSPGDALYLPRGWIHSATALGGTTVHLTIGVPAFTVSDLAEALLADSLRSRGLRAALPIGIGLPGAALRPHLEHAAEELRAVLSKPDLSGLETLLSERLDGLSRPEPVRPVGTIEAITDLDPRLPLRWRAGLTASLVADGDAVALRLRDRTIRFPMQCGTALESLHAGLVAPAGALPGLDQPDSLTVSRRLLREAIVVPATAP